MYMGEHFVSQDILFVYIRQGQVKSELILIQRIKVLGLKSFSFSSCYLWNKFYLLANNTNLPTFTSAVRKYLLDSLS